MKTLHRQDWALRAIERMKAQKITQDALCRALGVTTAAISHYLTGRRDPSLDQLALIAKTLKMSPAELVYGADHQHNAIPILAWSDVVHLKLKNTDAVLATSKETIPCFYGEHSQLYALRVQDDSMFSPLNLTHSFRENSIIVVDPTEKPKENQFAIALCRSTHEVILRQYVKTQGKYYLKPINQQYSMTIVNNTVELKGSVIAQIAVCK